LFASLTLLSVRRSLAFGAKTLFAKKSYLVEMHSLTDPIMFGEVLTGFLTAVGNCLYLPNVVLDVSTRLLAENLNSRRNFAQLQARLRKKNILRLCEHFQKFLTHCHGNSAYGDVCSVG
jgi:hypothetical protein